MIEQNVEVSTERTIQKTNTSESEVWHLKGPDTQATGTFSSSGFVIHQGSTCRKSITPSAKNTFLDKKRIALLVDGVLTETESQYVFAEDYEFNSPSGAAVVALGRNANGWQEWKNPQGHSLDEVKRKNSQAATTRLKSNKHPHFTNW